MRGQDRTARISGEALLLICASALLSNGLVVAGDPAATVPNFVGHESWRKGDIKKSL